MQNTAKYLKSGLGLSLIAISVIGCTNAEFTTSTSSGSSSGSTTTTTTATGACSGSSTVPVTMSGGLANGSATINLYNNGSGYYYGNISVYYTYYGAGYNALYSASAGANISIPSLYNNGEITSAYNYWYNSNSNFSGFFQNSVGALVLSVSSVDSNGCASGSLYYENFPYTGAVQSPYRECWFISAGPFDCQDGGIENKSSLVPTSGYTLLGSFTGLPVSLAFQ